MLRIANMTKGRIVYDRPKHLFKWSDAFRILRKIEDPIPPDKIGEAFQALYGLADEIQLTLGSPEYASYLMKKAEDEWKREIKQSIELAKTIGKFLLSFVDDLIIYLVS